MTTTDLLLSANPYSLKSNAKATVGRLVASVKRSKATQMYRRPVREPQRLTERLILCYLKQRSVLESRSGFFERLHQDFWSGEGGAVYADNCKGLLDELCLQGQARELEVVRELWDDLSLDTIVEFGTNDGRLLSHLHESLEGSRQSIGIDINKVQIARKQEHYRNQTDLRFVSQDASKWVHANGSPRTLYVSNGGVLEYFPRERLNEMLKCIASRCKPAAFFASEPIAADHDGAFTGSIPFGSEMSFSHHYDNLFRSNGFRVVHQRKFVHERWTMMATIAICD